MLLDFQKEAIRFYKEKCKVLCQDNPKLWNDILNQLFKYIPQMKIKRLCNGLRAIFGLKVIKIKNNWPLLIQLIGMDSSAINWICVSHGVLYNGNFNNAIMMSVEGLNWCMLLIVAQQELKLAYTYRTYWMIPSNMFLLKHFLLKETLPVRKGWVFGNVEVTKNKLCQLCN